MNQHDSVTFSMTAEQFHRGVERILNYDAAVEIQTLGEKLAMEIIEKLGATAFTGKVGETFEYHIAVQAIGEALKAINAAMSDVRNSWSEDSKERIKTYRKRNVQRKAGQLEWNEDEIEERR